MVEKQDSDFGEAAVAALAREIFVEQFGRTRLNDRQLTFKAFAAARTFLEQAKKIDAGQGDATDDENNPLDEAFAPNLKDTHPINLMSRAKGDLKKVIEILNELEAKPAAETYRQFEWGKPEVNIARALFPAVVNRSKQFEKAK